MAVSFNWPSAKENGDVLFVLSMLAQATENELDTLIENIPIRPKLPLYKEALVKLEEDSSKDPSNEHLIKMLKRLIEKVEAC